MKKILSTLVLSLVATVMLFAQAPQTFSYQTVVRDNNWQVIQNQSIGVQVSIIEDVANGSVVYAEEHIATTNDIGLINLAVGGGTVAQGLFSNIDWGNHSYFMKISVDVSGGSNYVAMGTTQLRSVPYALFAETSNNAGPQGIQGVAGNDGVDGVDGIDGTNGLDGIDGVDGLAGAQGIQGLQGDTGVAGPQGIQGFAGNDGADGTDGVDGLNGTNGAVGATGPQGIQGVAGNDGADGTNGIDGNDGADGLNGTNGTNGAVGATGLQGIAGNDGADGTNGIDGNDGADGLNGTNGVNGAVGATGAQGIQGIAGLNGTNSVCGFSIGDTAYGGVIFYLDATGCHGLVAKATDEPGLYLWSSVYFPVYSLSRGIFAGAHNTKKIIAKTSMQGITCPAATQVSLPYGGFNDWYLPSIDELDMMFVNLHLQGLGGFANNNYWSSTEYNDSYAWKLDFINGHHDYSIKAYTYFLNVRAVRAF